MYDYIVQELLLKVVGAFTVSYSIITVLFQHQHSITGTSPIVYVHRERERERGEGGGGERVRKGKGERGGGEGGEVPEVLAKSNCKYARGFQL